MTYQQAIQLACDQLGSQAGLAKAIEVAPAIVHQWRSGVRPVPVQHCLAIERATNGVVSRKDLRPDDWHLIWPELGTSTAPTRGEPEAAAAPAKEAPVRSEVVASHGGFSVSGASQAVGEVSHD